MQKCEKLEKYTLPGFDEDACRNYLTRRFSSYSDPSDLANRAFKHIGPIIEKDENKRILPFVVDLLAAVAEDAQGGAKIGFNLSLEGIGYKCLGSTTDYLVASVLRRESVRQSVEAPIDEVMETFWELAVSFGDTFSLSELEELVGILCPADTPKILRNPLLDLSNQKFCRFKYDFLSDYFKSLYIINTISRKPSSKSMLVKLISRYPYGDGEVFSEVSKYFRENPDQLKSGGKKIIELIKKDDDIPEIMLPSSEDLRAISFIVRIISELPESQSSKKGFTQNIREAFNASDGKISHLSIFGDCVPINFKDLEIRHSMFIGYKSFTRSRFSNTKFITCYFDKTSGEVVSESFTPSMFHDCRLGDLEGVIVEKSESVTLNRALTERELRKYFITFYNGGRFVDKKKAFFKHSDRVRGIGPKFDDALIKQGVLEVRVQKSDHAYFQVSQAYQSSIYSFITNNRVDAKISEIIGLIK